MSSAIETIAGVASTSETAPFINPYAGHRLLSEREQEVLGEYARLAATIKRIAASSSSLSSSKRHATLLSDLRILERKMGLVLTLFKASVWSLIQTHQDEMEERQRQEQDMSSSTADTTIINRAQ